jgi:hypothetical protein
LVDAYFGPPDIAAAVDAESPVEPTALVAAADALLDELDDGWLRGQATATTSYVRSTAVARRPSAGEHGRRPGRCRLAGFTGATGGVLFLELADP